VLLWDLDGTLLTTARAGIHAVEEAVFEVCGERPDFDGLQTAGLTDSEVVVLALETAGCDASADTAEQALRAYERHLPACLHRRRGRVLPGVREALEDLQDDDGVESLLLTGNTVAGARAKLAHYGLDPFFTAGGAFCEGPEAREEIARRGLARATAILDSPDPGRIYLIGDTPRDIDCGATIGVRTVAVATGSYTSAALADHHPWLLVERIPEPARFRQFLGLTGSVS
jgi:phosphoglycolate phosphatase-like HAD superfamily hydrolase